MNHITIELCAEDRARLDKILAALENHPNCGPCLETVKDLADAIEAQPEAPKQEEHEAPKQEEPEAPKQEATEPEPAAKYTPNDIQQAAVRLIAAGKKQQVREIVQTYAGKISDIPTDKCDEVMAKLAALEG